MSVAEVTQQLPRVLVVDDDHNNLDLIRHVFQKNFDVTCAESGQEALANLRRSSFDAVCLDIMMPDVSGLDILQMIRRSPKLATLPVILISALSDTRDVVRGLELGANDYLPKPFDIHEAVTRISTHIRLKRLEDERQRTIEELANAQKMQESLLRVASHDLKAPLQNIRMAEYMLRDVVGGDSTGQELLDSLTANVENMQRVIDLLLDVAACRSGKIEIKPEYVAVDAICWDLGMQYYMTALAKLIQLEVGETNGIVIADPNRLMQVLGNLVSNAIKYSPENTTVTIWAESLGDYIRINVADQGPGIPPEERPKLFKEFGKLSTRPTAGESSTGLGLWIAKQLMKLQKGDIGVDCPPDGGSVFWVLLPAYKPE
jgi:signal transduction histidine kinase